MGNSNIEKSEETTMSKRKYTFIDLFAGIGGFHTALHSVGAKCVFTSK